MLLRRKTVSGFMNRSALDKKQIDILMNSAFKKDELLKTKLVFMLPKLGGGQITVKQFVDQTFDIFNEYKSLIQTINKVTPFNDIVMSYLYNVYNTAKSDESLESDAKIQAKLAEYKQYLDNYSVNNKTLNENKTLNNLSKINPEVNKIMQDGVKGVAAGKIKPQQFLERSYAVLKANKTAFDVLKLPIDFDTFFVEVHQQLLADMKGADPKIIVDYSVALKTWQQSKVGTSSTSPKDVATGVTALIGTAPIVQSRDVAAITSTPITGLGSAAAGGSEANKRFMDTMVKPLDMKSVAALYPGLAQGADYAAIPRVTKPPTGCPSKNTGAPTCDCQLPIMPDGKPFNPNDYIRKDSIPCWNCSLPTGI